MDPTAHAQLLDLLNTDKPIALWAAAVTDKTLASLCQTLCSSLPKTRAARIAALQNYLAIPARYSSLLATWGAHCRSEYSRYTRHWPKTARLYPAHVHFVQEESGSGVLLSKELVLTCAHCVCDPAGEDDDDDDEEDEDEECAAADARRIGRVKVLLLPSGGYLTATCIAADSKADLALLRIDAASPLLARVAAFPAVCAAPTASKVVCVGNPCEFDLEATCDKKIVFEPPLFHTSTGRVTGPTDPKRLRLGLGAMRHTAWTYWGHSGAPLINEQGEVCGIHSSWDEDRGTRHCASAAQIAEFVGKHTKAGAAAGAAAEPLAVGGGGGGAAPAPSSAPQPLPVAKAAGGVGLKRKRM